MAIQLPRGIGELEALIHLIENKDAVKKVIEEIQKATKVANDRIELVAKAKDIEKMQSATRTELTQAIKAKEKAEVESEALLYQTNLELATLRSEHEAAITKEKATIKDRQAAVAKREKEVVAREQSVQDTMNAAKTLNLEATALKETADLLIAKAEENLKLFKEVTDRVNH